jgi:hypothetical protein
VTSRPPEVTRWTDSTSASSEVPAELRRLLEVSRQQLGTSAEVALLAQSLARALPDAGLGGNSAGPSGLAPVPVAARWSAWVAAGSAVLAGAVTWWALGSRSLPEPSLEASAPPLGSQPAEPAPQPVPPAVLPEPVVQRPSVSKRATPRHRGHSAPKPSVVEAELLERAQAALASRPKDALALTREHQRRFPRGLLVQEREVIAIEALNRLGQKRAASAKAAEFEERYRGSVHQPRLDDDMERAPAAGGSAPHVAPAP